MNVNYLAAIITSIGYYYKNTLHFPTRWQQAKSTYQQSFHYKLNKCVSVFSISQPKVVNIYVYIYILYITCLSLAYNVIGWYMTEYSEDFIEEYPFTGIILYDTQIHI